MSRRDGEVLFATPIHDQGLLALKRCPGYKHEGSDIDKVLRFMRRQDIRPLDVDTADRLKGLFDPEKAERLRERAPIRKWKKRAPKEIAEFWDLPLSFIKELERQKKWGPVVY
jgi:tRNA A37 threonylcarbamoyladenosine synthetase subunit TsaC/SUA5/YrdC